MNTMISCLQTKLFLLTLLTPFLVASVARADCFNEYKEKLELRNSQYSHVQDGPEILEDIFRLAGKIAAKPLSAMGKFNELTLETKGPLKVLPGAAVFIAPPVMFPFTTLAAIATVGLGVPTLAAVMGVEWLRIPRSFKRDLRLYTLMSEIAACSTDLTEKPGYELKKLLKHSVVKDSYIDSGKALADLKLAYQANFFCQKDENSKEVKILNRKEILESIESGEMQEFIRTRGVIN